MKHKFSIVCENSSTPGYTTEKIVQALAANCIPVYWGDPEIKRVFNSKAFVNVQDYKSVEDVVNKVKQIDEDERLWHKMLMEPALIDDSFSKENQMKLLEIFLSNIFSVPVDRSKRRNRDCIGRKYIDDRRIQCSIMNRANCLTNMKVYMKSIFNLKKKVFWR